MSKFKRIIEFILALLNFLFHFKSSTDDKTAIVTKTYPSPAVPPGTEKRDLQLPAAERLQAYFPKTSVSRGASQQVNPSRTAVPVIFLALDTGHV